MKTKQKIRSTLTLPELIIRSLKDNKETFVSTFSSSQCHLCVCVMWLWRIYTASMCICGHTQRHKCVWLCRNMRDTLMQSWPSQIQCKSLQSLHWHSETHIIYSHTQRLFICAQCFSIHVWLQCHFSRHHWTFLKLCYIEWNACYHIT